MTLDEAIKHCEEVADGLTEQGKCAECAAEHRQLAEWLSELKQLKEQEPCEDAISRKAAIDAMVKIEQDDIGQYGSAILQWLATRPAIEALNGLPSVTPQYTDAEIQKMQELEQAEIEKAYELGKASRPKIGHWICTLEDWNKWECSECGFTKRTDVHVSIGYKYCPKCGCRMESEVEE